MQSNQEGEHQPKSHTFRTKSGTITGSRLPKRELCVRTRSSLRGTTDQRTVGLAEARKRHNQKRCMERERLAAGTATNPAYLEALEDKEFVFEIQAVILGELASEENRMVDVCESVKDRSTEAAFAKHAREAIETLSMLKY